MKGFELATLEKGLSAEERLFLLQSLAAQIAKDIYPIELGDIPETPTIEWIRLRLHQTLNDSSEHISRSLSAILYRIDIPEKRIKQAMAESNPNQRLELLVQFILEREAYKVWLRHHYRP
ncbi:MAG: hypothetical protein ACK478_11315 [Flavobacteriales bacterium]|jgi:hypothetical protein